MDKSNLRSRVSSVPAFAPVLLMSLAVCAGCDTTRTSNVFDGPGPTSGFALSVAVPDGMPMPSALSESFLSRDASGIIQRAFFTAPDAKPDWYLDLQPTSFELMQTVAGMSAEAKYTLAATADTITITLHGAGMSAAKASARANAGFGEILLCYTRAGAKRVSFSFTCSSPFPPAVAGLGQAIVTVGRGGNGEFCHYGQTGTSGGLTDVTPSLKAGKIIIDADLDGQACFSATDNLGISAIAVGGDVNTDGGGQASVDAVIAIGATAL